MLSLSMFSPNRSSLISSFFAGIGIATALFSLAGCGGSGGSSQKKVSFVALARNPTVGYMSFSFSLSNRTSTLIGTTAEDTAFIAIAERPSTGEVYTFSTDTDTLYTLDMVTGLATEVGPLGVDLPYDEYGMSFDPTTDEIRLISGNDNVRIDPTDGSLISADSAVTPTSSVYLGGLAYSPPVGNPAATTLYYADNGNVRFGTIGGVNGNPSPNGGVAIDLGSPETFSQYMIGLDFASDGTAYLLCARTGDNMIFLYTVNRTTGLATLVGEVDGDIVPQSGEVVGFAIVETE